MENTKGQSLAVCTCPDLNVLKSLGEASKKRGLAGAMRLKGSTDTLEFAHTMRQSRERESAGSLRHVVTLQMQVNATNKSNASNLHLGYVSLEYMPNYVSKPYIVNCQLCFTDSGPGGVRGAGPYFLILQT